MKYLIKFIILILSVLASLPASATFIGDQIEIAAPGIPGSSTSVIAAAGVDLIFNDIWGLGTGPDEYITIDIFDSMIQIDLFAQDNFWGWQPGIPDDPFMIVLSSLEQFQNVNSQIQSISTSTSGFFASGLSASIAGPHTLNVFVPLSSYGETCGGAFCGRITILVESKDVPEPSPLSLMGLGLLALYKLKGVRRRAT